MTLTAILIVVGRILLGLYFLAAGLRNLTRLDVHEAHFTARGIPGGRAALLTGLIVQIVAGLMVTLGFYPAIGAIGLIGFTLMTVYTHHNVWDMAGEERTVHLRSIEANLALIGGFLLVIATA